MEPDDTTAHHTGNTSRHRCDKVVQWGKNKGSDLSPQLRVVLTCSASTSLWGAAELQNIRIYIHYLYTYRRRTQFFYFVNLFTQRILHVFICFTDIGKCLICATPSYSQLVPVHVQTWTHMTILLHTQYQNDITNGDRQRECGTRNNSLIV